MTGEPFVPDPLEAQSWREFHALAPFDDRSRYHRPAALVAASVGGADVGDLLDWLDRKPPVTDGYSAADIATMKTFGLKPKRKT